MSKSYTSQHRIQPVTLWERVTWAQTAVNEAERLVLAHPGEPVYVFALATRRKELTNATTLAKRGQQ